MVIAFVTIQVIWWLHNNILSTANNIFFKEILYLNLDGPNGWSWDVMDVSLSQPRSYHVAFPLESVSEAICNPDFPTIPPATIPEGTLNLT